MTHPHTLNQKIAQYSMKSATRIFLNDAANFGRQSRCPNVVALFIAFELETRVGR